MRSHPNALLFALCASLVHSTADATVPSCRSQALPQNLAPPGLPASAEFGASVAMHHNTLVVGAPGADNEQGRVYFFQLQQGDWEPDGFVTGQDSAPGDRFGSAVALWQNWVLIGAPGHDGAGADSGAAYVFYPMWFPGNPAWWGQGAKLVASDAMPGDHFGASVARYHNDYAVGAPGDDGVKIDQGSVYVFKDAYPAWPQWKLTNNNPQTGEAFGTSTAILPDRVFVGAPATNLAFPYPSGVGSAHVFARLSLLGTTSWAKIDTLYPSPFIANAAFGTSIAVDHATERLLIGAPGTTNAAGAATGGACVFTKSSASKWEQSKLLVPTPAGAGDGAGRGVALTSTEALVAGNVNVFHFVEDSGSWGQKPNLSAPFKDLTDGVTENLGPTVAAYGLRAAVGRPLGGTGASFAFELCGGRWENLGSGTVGLGGFVKLRGAGPLSAESPFALRVKYARANALAMLLVRVGDPNVAVFAGGGLLYAWPWHLAIPMLTSATGEIHLPAVMPPGYPEVKAVFQFVVQDKLALGGATVSNAVITTNAP